MSPIPFQPAPPTTSPRPTVLIVDDEPHIRALVEHTLEDLEDEGVELLTASDGAEALQMIDRVVPSLVILDVMMPKLSGYDVCRAIRQRGLTDVRVVMLTAKGQDLDKERGGEVGADHYATKPFDPDELLAVVRRLLEPPES
jgi:two-component system alkaline phosphatase synthesis response regulator PhoP